MLPGTPQVITDLLGAIVASVLAGAVGHGDIALVLDSELDITGEPCAISFLLLPEAGGVNDLLAPLGLAEASAYGPRPDGECAHGRTCRVGNGRR